MPPLTTRCPQHTRPPTPEPRTSIQKKPRAQARTTPKGMEKLAALQKSLVELVSHQKRLQSALCTGPSSSTCRVSPCSNRLDSQTRIMEEVGSVRWNS